MVFRFPIINTGPVKKFFETKSKKNTDKSPIISGSDSTFAVLPAAAVGSVLFMLHLGTMDAEDDMTTLQVMKLLMYREI